MEMLKIMSYTDAKYTDQHLGTLSLPINPESLKFEKGIVYQEDKQLGGTNSSNVFAQYKPEELSFDVTIDCTGAVEGTKKEDKVKDKVAEIEEHLYTYNGEGHRPSYIIIAYGELLFKGQLTNFKEDYILFNDQGVPLRAEVSLRFSGFRNSDEDKKKNSKRSPDMSRLVILKEGDTLASLCNQTYGSSLFVNEVARFNNLNGFRDIPAGTEILLPPLKKN